MAKLLIEDAVLFLCVFYLLLSIILPMNVFDSMTPGQRYNSSTGAMESYSRNQNSIFGNMTESSDLMEKYNNLSVIDPGAMLNPIAIVTLVGAYLAFLMEIVSSTILSSILTIFIGSALAHVVTFILNLMIFIVMIRVITGRLRFS